jgi:exosortase K
MEKNPQMTGEKGPLDEPGENRKKTFREAVDVRRFLLENGPFHGAGLAVLLCLKIHLSRAGADDLQWMLLPLARLVEWTTGIPFERELHGGFISLARGIVIAPSCSGVNFLAVSFAVLLFSFVHRIGPFREKVLWLVLSGILAFCLTLAVNTLRIVCSISLFQWDIYGGIVTAGRVHRLAGTVLYLSALLAAFRSGRSLVRRFFSPGRKDGGGGAPGEGPAWVLPPVLWYLGMTVGIPLLGLSGAGRAERLGEHAATVAAICAAALLPAVPALFRRGGSGERGEGPKSS